MVVFQEGDVAAIPLTDRIHSVVVVSRGSSRADALWMVFFPLTFDGLPTEDDVRSLRFADSLISLRNFPDPLTTGSWPIVGRIDPWDRADWPPPIGVFAPRAPGRRLNYFDEDNPGKFVRTAPATAEDAARLVPDVPGFPTGFTNATQIGSAYHLASELRTLLIPNSENLPKTQVELERKLADPEPGSANPDADTVIIDFAVTDHPESEADSLLMDHLIAALEPTGIGEFDGHEHAEGTYVVYLEGESAENVWSVVAPIVTSPSLRQLHATQAKLSTRRPAGSRTIRIDPESLSVG